MISVVVAGLMWALVVILSLRARRRPDNSLLAAAGIIATSMTTNISEVYLWAALWMPWPNALDVVANLLLIIGVAYLATAIRRGAAAVGTGKARGQHWTRSAAVVTVTGMIVAFCFIDNPEPSTTFMLSYGDQPATAAYSMIQYLFILARSSRTPRALPS